LQTTTKLYFRRLFTANMASIYLKRGRTGRTNAVEHRTEKGVTT
jgi:hypothetical protein